MRTSISVAAAIAGTLTTAVLGLTSAAAAPAAHHPTARADWKRGAKVSAAEQSRYWLAARDRLAHRFTHERYDLAALAAIPLTSTTAKQRAVAVRVTRELNGFFDTPDLYDVAPGNPLKIARADWIRSNHVAAARANFWLGGAVDELGAYGKKDASERAAIKSLESIPLTSTTAKQRATAHRDVLILDKFFQTPGVGT